MSGPIQTLPQGLLGLLQLKVQGRNPRDLAESVQPTLEMSGFYLESSVNWSPNTVGFADAVIAPGTAGPSFLALAPGVLSPGENECWYVHGGAMQIGVLATATLTGARIHAVHQQTSTPSRLRYLGSLELGTLGAVAVNREWIVPIEGGFFMQDGEQVGATVGYINALAVANMSVRLQLRYSRVSL